MSRAGLIILFFRLPDRAQVHFYLPKFAQKGTRARFVFLFSYDIV